MPPGSRNAFSPNPVNAMGVPAGFGVEGTGTPSTMDFEVLRGMLGGAWQNLVSPLYLARDTAQSVRDMAPRGFYADLYEAGKRVAANPRAVPGMVQNALKQSAEYARSSPYAMGETIGGMLDVRNMLKRPPVANMAEQTARPRVATYFSGARTLESALPNAEHVMAAEFNPRINEFANRSHGTDFPARDVNTVDVDELKRANPTLFHASPVCKNFSAAKTMRGATDLDRRSAESVARAVREVSPPVVTIENVPQYADTALFKHITDALDEKGYKWDVVIHDAADYGAPQSRKRMLLRAVREGELPPVPPKIGGKDWFGSVSDLLDSAPASSIPPVERKRLDDMIARGRLDPSKPIITMGGSGFGNTWAASNAGQVAPTLKAANEKPRIIMPDGTVKTVTPRMMARLMGLGDNVAVPDSPTLAKTVLGNGISGDVTRALVAPLLNRPMP